MKGIRTRTIYTDVVHRVNSETQAVDLYSRAGDTCVRKSLHRNEIRDRVLKELEEGENFQEKYQEKFEHLRYLLTLELNQLLKLQGLAVPEVLNSTCMFGSNPRLDMQDLRWGCLKSYVSGEGRKRCLPINRKIVGFFRDTAYELHKVHERGVLHRDIKPANIIPVGGISEGLPFFIDFGLSNLDFAQVKSAISGTPGYISPEQILRKGNDVRSEIYSLTMVLYRVFASRLPFDSHYDEKLESDERITKTLIEQAKGVIKDPRDFRKMPEGLADLLLWGLEMDPARRPQSAAILGQLLDHVIDGL
jgi:serine/threonine protein kinase